MSLYVGRLSPRIRKEELERVFRRFGRCNFHIKGDFGFVVYDVNADAERALRALRGKNIGGEQISLSWSNRQPRPFDKPARRGRFYGPYRGRNFNESYNRAGSRNFHDQGAFSNGSARIPTSNLVDHQSDHVFHREAGRVDGDNDLGVVKGRTLIDGVVNEGSAGDLKPVENDRGSGPMSDGLTGHGMENSNDFDRYEPCNDNERADERENNQSGGSHSPPYRGRLLDRGGREHSLDEAGKHQDKSTSQLSCYRCGLFGHIACDCQEGDPMRESLGPKHSREETYSRERNEGRLKRFRPNSRGRPNESVHTLTASHDTRYKDKSNSRKFRKAVSRATPPEKEADKPKVRKCSQIKKGRKHKHEITKKGMKKRRSRRSDVSSHSSESSTARSHSASRSSMSGSDTSSSSGSRPVSGSSHSANSHSRSASLLSSSKSEDAELRSRSTLPLSLSLSVSLDRKPSSSPRNEERDVSLSTSPKDNFDHKTNPLARHLLPVDMESSHLESTPQIMKVADTSTHFQGNDETNVEHPGHGCEGTKYSPISSEYKNRISLLDMQKDDALTSGKHSENLGERSNLQGAPSSKLNVQTPDGSESRSSMRISAQEMFLALRHYKHAAPDECKLDISIERYFGSARLWPWEMIYYRRLKKGPISTENYARRLEQNREFGIVDKYVRSSSGWGEHIQNKP